MEAERFLTFSIYFCWGGAGKQGLTCNIFVYLHGAAEVRNLFCVGVPIGIYCMYINISQEN
jgi:hypothetical protein